MDRYLRVLFILAAFCVAGAWSVTAFAAPDEGATLTWEQLPVLPDTIGYGGPIVGTHNGALIVAGGANFPNQPVWDGGGKGWHDRITTLEPGAPKWTTGFNLPRPLAYAPAVSTAEGLVVLGGETFGPLIDPETGDPILDKTTGEPTTGNFPVADVLQIQWDSVSQKATVVSDAFPSLPKPSHKIGAAILDNVIYVLASHAESEKSERLDSKSFWALDLSLSPSERRWETLEPWPGAPRNMMAVAVQNTGADDRYNKPKCLYMFSGSTWVKGPDGKPDLTRFEFFTDCYRYNPKTKAWSHIADLPFVPDQRAIDFTGYQFDSDRKIWRPLPSGAEQSEYDINNLYEGLPRPASAAAAIGVGQSHVLLFGGATGRYITMGLKDRPLFHRDVLAYHTITDTWVVAGRMPQGVVTTSAVEWGGKIVIPSGETRPGVRTPAVQAATLQTPGRFFGWVNTGVVVGYLALMVGMGFYFSRREKTTQDFFLAGRRIPWWAAGLSIYATQLSAITFVATPAVGYTSNWLVYPSKICILLMAPIVIAFYLPFFRSLNITTAYEYLERRFNLAARLYGSVSFIAFQLVRMSIVVYLPAIALSAITGLDSYLCIVIMGVLAIAYTALGGMEAVIWTDVLQVIVLWGGMFLAVILILIDRGGVANIYHTALSDQKFTMFNWSLDPTQMASLIIFFGTFMLQFGPYTTDQAVIQRYLTTKDEKAAARSIWLNGLLTIRFSFLFFALGTCLYVYFKARPESIAVGMDNDQIFPLFMAYHLPTGVAGLVVAGVFAASMSSLDSSMHSISTALTTDFYKRFKPEASDRDCLRLARWIIVVAGILAMILASIAAGMNLKSLFFTFQKAIGLLSSGLVGVFMLGIFTRKANGGGRCDGSAGQPCRTDVCLRVHEPKFLLVFRYRHRHERIGRPRRQLRLPGVEVG